MLRCHKDTAQDTQSPGLVKTTASETYLETLYFNQFLQPVDNDELPVFPVLGHVPGVEPALTDGVLGGDLVPVVAHHHLGPRHAELAVRLWREQLSGLDVHHLGHGVGYWEAATSDEAVLERLNMSYRGGLSHAESLLEHGLVRGAFLHELVDQSRPEGSCPTGDELDGSEVVRLHGVVGGEEADQRGHQVQQGRLVGTQGLHVHLGVKLGQRDHLHAQPQPQQHDRVHRVNVEKRENCQSDLLVSGLHHRPARVDC